MIESRVRNALDLLDAAHRAVGYAATDPLLMDEMAGFLVLFPEGSYEEFWHWHMERLQTRLEFEAAHPHAGS